MTKNTSLPHRIHFMGIGGIGVSALASVAQQRGCEISGCDPASNEQTRQLASTGVKIYPAHSAEHSAMTGAELVVHTSAVPPDHPELLAAKDTCRRGEFLARLLADEKLIGIAGAHGKTTTTWMIAHIFITAGKDPTVLLGGVAAALHGNYRVGNNTENLAISELDESDGSFLLPRVTTGIITNIEPEHLAYYQNFAAIEKAFTQFAAQIAPKNFLVADLDNESAAKIFHSRAGKKTGYGLTAAAQNFWHLDDLRYETGRQIASIFNGEKMIGELSLPFIGKHNLANALAAIATAAIYEIPPATALAALANCQSVQRRWEKIGEKSLASKHRVEFFSDYAHHPTEVRATLTGAKEIYSGKILVVFQPHLFSRTRDHASEFAAALAPADRVIVTDIYPAREEPLSGISAALITSALPPEKLAATTPLPVRDAIASALTLLQTENFEVVIFMGAGDIDDLARKKMTDYAE